jgi:hypothetical protein
VKFLLMKTLGSALLTLAGALLISIAIKDLVRTPAAEAVGLETARTLTASLGLWLVYKGLGGHPIVAALKPAA